MRIEVLERDRRRVRAVNVVQRRRARAQTNPLKVGVEIEHPGSLAGMLGCRCPRRRPGRPT